MPGIGSIPWTAVQHRVSGFSKSRVIVTYPVHSVHERLPMQGHWLDFQHPHFQARGSQEVASRSRVFIQRSYSST